MKGSETREHQIFQNALGGKPVTTTNEFRGEERDKYIEREDGIV